MDITDPMFQLVKERYDSQEEIEKYCERARSGLLDWEKTICNKYYKKMGAILDIGCGCGRETLALAKYGHSMTGVDISARQIEIARSIAEEDGHDINYQLTTGSEFEFASGSFDYVIIWSQVLGNIPGEKNRLDILKEVFRCIRLQGVFTLSVHNRDVCEPIARQKGLIESGTDYSLEDGDFIEAHDSPSMGSCYWHYFTRGELIALIESAGFTMLECDVAPKFGQKGWHTILVAVAMKNKIDEI